MVSFITFVANVAARLKYMKEMWTSCQVCITYLFFAIITFTVWLQLHGILFFALLQWKDIGNIILHFSIVSVKFGKRLLLEF